ncbi:MAG: saccharopine dehydrogenase NADP-binding domain-containing protein [Chitinophagaceae bacterium]|nr:saccharopine dehydrogenase NADP-binding domain-containing protein [Chitinophagaceae bacterium]
MQNQFLLYGANGYTGKLIAKLSAEYGLRPILAGRSENLIKPLADELQLPFCIIDLQDTVALQEALSAVKLVLHAAGPYVYTAKQMIEACLKTGTHYIDINGDISVFEMLKKQDAAATKKNIMLMPGVGFDVVPTDCIALRLKNRMPDATHLKLAFATIGGGLSHGTATTMAGKLGEGGSVRENGKIVKKPLGQKGTWIEFGSKKIFTMTIPWGDISTAYTTTGIPNIEVYTGISVKVYRMLKMQWAFNWLLRTGFIRNIIKQKIKERPAGPSDEQRKKSSSLVWGEVSNAPGKTIQACLSCLDGYTLTAHSSLLISKKILEGNFKPGYQTPAGCYGENLVMEIPGTKMISGT